METIENALTGSRYGFVTFVDSSISEMVFGG
jgi:hypothetical protein